MSTPDHYAALDVPPTADARTIKRAYFTKVRQFPPEKHPEDFRRVREAYEVLSDEAQRHAYDAGRTAEERYGPETSTLLDKAQAAFADTDYPTAAQALEAALAQHPDLDGARAMLFDCRINAQAFAEAEAVARTVIERNPGMVAGLLMLAQAQTAQERRVDAAETLRRARQLDPDDLRPLGHLISSHANDDLGHARDFIEKELAKSLPPHVVFFLRCEELALAHAQRKDRDAKKLLTQFEALAREQSTQQSAASFLESQAAQLIRARQVQQATRVLAAATRLDPASVAEALCRPVRARVSELPPASRQWLTEERARPEALLVRARGWLLDVALGLPLAVIWAWSASAALDSQSGWSGAGLVFGGVWFSALAVFSLHLLRRAWAAANDRSGRYWLLHPLYLLRVDFDALTAWPLLSLYRNQGTHHSDYGAYSRTEFHLGFLYGDCTLVLRDQDLGNRLAGALGEVNERLLTLLETGYLSAEEGIDFLPPALRGRKRAPASRRWLASYAGAAVLGLGLVFASSALGARRASDSLWLTVSQKNDAATFRGYLLMVGEGQYAAEAKARLAASHQQAVARVRAALPKLAPAMERAGPRFPTLVAVALERDPAAPSLPRLPLTEVLLPSQALQSPSTEQVALLEQRVREGLRRALAEAAGGPGWFQVAPPTGKADVALTLRYRLDFTPRAIRITGPGAPDGPERFLQPEVSFEVTMQEATLQGRLSPPDGLSLPRAKRWLTPPVSADLIGEALLLYAAEEAGVQASLVAR